MARHAEGAWSETCRAYAGRGFPLEHGAPARVGRLRAYGNAINAEAAAAFIAASVDVRNAGREHFRLTVMSEMTTDEGIFT